MKSKIAFVIVLLVAMHTVAGQKFISEHKTMDRVAELNISRLPKPNNQYKGIEKKREEREAKRPVEQNRKEVRQKKNKVQKPAFPVETISVIAQNNIARPGVALINESPCITYPGLHGGGSIPADVSAAAGFDHLMMALNDSTAILDKYGNVLRSERNGDFTGFWSAIDTTNHFDPKIVYHPYYNRWFYVIATDPRSAESAFLIAVSQTFDPMQGWNYYRVDADNENDQWFDYPSIGFNNKWFVVNGNMGENTGTGLTQSRTFIFNIGQLMAGTSVNYTVNNYSSILDPQFTFCPALTYDPNQNDLWLVTNDDIDDNDLRFFKITGGASSPSISEEGFISIGSDWGQGNMNIAPQAGTSARVNANDHDVLSVVWRNGRLYIAQTIFLPDGSSPTTCTIQIVVCNPYNETVTESFRIGSSSSVMYAHPCLAVNNNNDLIISCSKFTNVSFPSAAVLVRRNGSPTIFESVFKAGEDWYLSNDVQGRNRWGDYTSAMIDPSDDNSVWLASEYSKTRLQPGNFGDYGSWWAKICTGNCVTNTIVSTTQPSGTYKKYEAGFSVIAQSEIQPGANIKLDAGTRIVLQPGFKALEGSRVRTFLEGCGGQQ